ncbi:hypothetical protein ACHAPJ_011215 [Fusarium lateritium]
MRISNAMLALSGMGYLVNTGQALDESIDLDSVARKRVVDTMNRFKDAEKQVQAVITHEMCTLRTA